MTEVCERYGISRPTAYKWVRRYREAGDDGLEERSRAAPVPAPDRVGHGGADRRGAAQIRVGRAQAAPPVAAPPSAYTWPAKSTVDDRPSVVTAPAASDPLAASRRVRRGDYAAESSVAGRLQGPAAIRDWPVLLPVDGDRPFFAATPRLSRPAVGAVRGGPTGLSGPVSGGGAS